MNHIKKNQRMKRSIPQIGSVLLSLLLCVGCSSDFLETTPTSYTNTEVVFSTTGNVAAAINGIAKLMYTNSETWSTSGETHVRMRNEEFPSQEFRANMYATNYYRLMNGQLYTNSSSNYGRYPWTYYYGIITSANAVILHVDEAEGEEGDKRFYKAQALTFRAYAYEKLMELYTLRWQDTQEGTTAGVVLRLDESTNALPQSTVAACYAQIYQDLEEAIQSYQTSGVEADASKFWLPSIQTAEAIYARAALNKQDYTKALEMAQRAEEKHPLMSNEEYLSGFCYYNSEWIFGSYDDATESKWYLSFGSAFACNGYDNNNSTYDCGGIEKELTDRMPTDDLRMRCFLTEDKFAGLDLYNGKGTEVQSDGSVKEVDHMNKTFGTLTSDEARAIARAYVDAYTPNGLEPAYQQENYPLNGQLKFWVFDSPGVSNICHIRSSEMVLIEAEANYFLGKEEAATQALLRLNRDSERNPNYTCTKRGEALLQEIMDYRELELWGEGFNWYDMKRWNRDIVRKSFAEGGNCYNTTAITIRANEGTWTWTIPDLEKNYNSEIR